MTNTQKTPVHEQAGLPTSKSSAPQRSSQLSPIVVPICDRLLHDAGILNHSTVLAATAACMEYGENAPIIQSLKTKQGNDFKYWTEFPPGYSVENVQRVREGKPSPRLDAFCLAVEKITGIQFRVADVVATEPDMATVTKKREGLIASAKARLIAGEEVRVGLDAPLWKQDPYAIGKPIRVGIEALSLELVQTPKSFTEYWICANYQDVRLRVGYLIVLGDRTAILFDSRSFVWGQSPELMVGRKLVRLVSFKGNINACLESLATSQLTALAS